MDQLSRGTRMGIATIGIILAIIFVALIVYYSGFAPAHPRVKHDILFIVLAIASLLLTWFSWPTTRGVE